MRIGLLASRLHDSVAAEEFDAIMRHGRLGADELVHIRMEQGSFLPLDLSDFDGLILGGSPFTTTDLNKSKVQQRVENELTSLLDEVAVSGLPFLGLCFGIGVVTKWGGGQVSDRFGENTSAVTIQLTDEGHLDPLLRGMPEQFLAYVGHKESCEQPPRGATVLATSAQCPVQLYRFGPAQYVTQFHPEMDADSVIGRMDAYPTAGYFLQAEIDVIKELVRSADVHFSHQVVANFVDICRTRGQGRGLPVINRGSGPPDPPLAS